MEAEAFSRDDTFGMSKMLVNEFHRSAQQQSWAREHAVEIVGRLLLAASTYRPGSGTDHEKYVHNTHLRALESVAGLVPDDKKRWVYDTIMAAAEHLFYEQSKETELWEETNVLYEIVFNSDYKGMEMGIPGPGDTSVLRVDYIKRVVTLIFDVKRKERHVDMTYFRVYKGFLLLLRLYGVFPEETRRILMDIPEDEWLRVCNIHLEIQNNELAEPVFRLFRIMDRPVSERFLIELPCNQWDNEDAEGDDDGIERRSQFYADFRHLCRISSISEGRTAELIRMHQEP